MYLYKTYIGIIIYLWINGDADRDCPTLIFNFCIFIDTNQIILIVLHTHTHTHTHKADQSAHFLEMALALASIISESSVYSEYSQCLA